MGNAFMRVEFVMATLNGRMEIIVKVVIINVWANLSFFLIFKANSDLFNHISGTIARGDFVLDERGTLCFDRGGAP